MELLVLGHLLGDFYFQSDKIAKEKTNKFTYLLFHIMIYGLCVGMPLVYLAQKRILASGAIILIMIMHGIVDKVKIYAESKYLMRRWLIFLIDQALHLVVIIITYWSLEIETSKSEIEFMGVGIHEIICIIVMMLICWRPASLFITTVFDSLSASNIENNGLISKDDNEVDTEKESIRAGRWIGILEREIILVLGLMGQYSAIGFVLTAKSLARYKQLENREFAERYLVGTLISAFIAFINLGIYNLIIIQR